MILIERGQLALDDLVTRWLPAFRPALPNGERPPIMVRQLLTHTSGLTYDLALSSN
jgi:CubicO group peptidase (beta-lactamase class C family)